VQSLKCCYVQNLCIASAYRPVQELIEEEKKVVMLFQLLARVNWTYT
jgi:hypothetical protein